LKYEEFFKFQTYMLYRKNQTHGTDQRFIKHFELEDVRRFILSLPFELTGDQKKAVNEILTDMQSDFQMCRLLQGDVGSGKTIVSFIAMYAAYLSGKQAVLMAPTEILAKQHFNNIQKIFRDYDINIELLYSSITPQQKRAVLERISSGETDFVVGTHAVFQQAVEFKDLGLIITDEQHRFGVRQRQMLQDKGSDADLLLMSATPIPRTLATSLYGDMDVSTIVETPNKGKVIHTTLIKKNSFMAIVKDIEKLLDQGNQMYVVCAAIDKSTEIPARNVNDVYNNLNDYFKGRYTLGLLHGQMAEEDKDDVQMRFANGEIDILVSTTVIEVGVDVKKANIMIIYDANRFGLSQLHQLRGRIGRGENEGHCYLLTSSTDEEALKRLQVIVDNTDGFKISYYDLLLRGPGDILGYRQSGLPTFILGNVVEDNELLQKSREDGKMVIEHLDATENENIREYLERVSAEDAYYLD
ncbi:MAG: ATP-dependent DNA helicase RecG, partial [Erysipelotrichaceae bacterium]|nr:ATP-dependent DNA helicase RecG [Erysipelotrichaceae bacterium]